MLCYPTAHRWRDRDS